MKKCLSAVKLQKNIMKYLLVIVMAVCVMVLPAQAASAASDGAWTVSSESGNAALPASARKIFSKAMGNLTGVDYTPICYLGKQVVAGTKYYYLCQARIVVPNAETTLKIVSIYKNLKGKYSVNKISNFRLSRYAKSHEVSGSAAGGITEYTKTSRAKLPSAVRKAFNRATKNLTGMSYRPIAYLGSQVVSGTNYMILCVGTTVTRTPQKHLYILTIYDQPWTKTSEITDIYGQILA